MNDWMFVSVFKSQYNQRWVYYRITGFKLCAWLKCSPIKYIHTCGFYESFIQTGNPVGENSSDTASCCWSHISVNLSCFVWSVDSDVYRRDRGLKTTLYLQSVDLLLNMWHYNNWRSVHWMKSSSWWRRNQHRSVTWFSSVRQPALTALIKPVRVISCF